MAVSGDHMAEAGGTPVAGAGSGWRSLLGNRLLLALLAVSLIPMALMGFASQQASSSALKTQAFKQLETVNTITGQSVERYFATLHDELRVLSEDRMISAAIREFTAGVAGALTDDGVDEKEANGEDDRIDTDDGGALSPTTLGDMRPAGDA